MDLSLLPHLSDEALQREASERGIEPSGLSRAALIEAIGAAGVAPSTRAAAQSDGIEVEARFEEPIRTKTFALLLVEQGEHERALPMLEELLEASPGDEALRAAHAETYGVLARGRARARPRERAEGSAVTLLRDALGCEVQWTVDAAGRAGARALLPAGEPHLTLRVIQVLAHGNRATETEERGLDTVPASGGAWVEMDPRARVVVAIGLSLEGRFAAIAHASDDRYAPARD